jgi:hypothetical protein
MTTLLFAFASSGAAAATPVGPLVGLGTMTKFAIGAAAMAVDSLAIYPALARGDNPEGNKLGDLELAKAQEGYDVNRLFGGTVRDGGGTLWQSKIREVEDPERGTKGGSGASYIRYRYYCDVAIEICRTRRGRPIKGIKHVFANGKPFWGPLASLSSSITAGQIVAENQFFDDNEIDDLTPKRRATETLVLISDEAAGGPDLTKYQTGRNVTIGGFTGAHGISAANLKIAANAAANSTSIQLKCFQVGRLSRNDTIVIQNDTGTYRVMENHDFNGTLSVPDTQTVTLRRTDTASLGLASSVVTDEVVTPTSGATANNGVFKPFSRGRRDATHSFLSFKTMNQQYDTLTPRFAGKSPISETIALSQSDTAFAKTQAGDVRFYYGTRTQLADPTIVEVEGPAVGAANVVAFRNIAYMFIEDLEVTDFLNMVPNFQFVVEPDEDDSLVTALSELVQDAGLSTAEIDLSAIPTTQKFGGAVVRGVQTIRTALQPWMLAYHLTSQQSNGVIKLMPRTSTKLVPLTGKTVAFAPGGKSPRPAHIGEVGDQGVTQYTQLKYINPDNQWQSGMVKADGSVVLSANVATLELEMTMTKDEAQRLVNTIFELGRVSARRTAVFDLSPRYLNKVSESDRGGLAIFGQDWEFVITRFEEGDNGVIACEGIEEDLEAFNQTATAEGTLGMVVSGGGDGPRTSQAAPVVLPMLMDLPPLIDEHVDQPGFYIAGTMALTGVPWRGFALYESWNPDSDYERVGEFATRAFAGRVLAIPLGWPAVDHRVVDYASVVHVEMTNPDDSLSSVSESDMLRGRNRFLLGREIVGIATWTLVSADPFTGIKTYEGSVLLRGIKDTFELMNSHVVGEQFLALDRGVYFVRHAASRIKEPRYYKLVANGGFIADADPELFAPDGETMKPFRPVSIVGKRNGSNDLIVTWERQARRSIQVLEQNVPIDAETERYKYRVLQGGLTSETALREVIIRIDPGDARTFTYTATNQSLDGLTPGDPVHFEFVPMSHLVHDGNATRVTL